MTQKQIRLALESFKQQALEQTNSESALKFFVEKCNEFRQKTNAMVLSGDEEYYQQLIAKYQKEIKHFFDFGYDVFAKKSLGVIGEERKRGVHFFHLERNKNYLDKTHSRLSVAYAKAKTFFANDVQESIRRMEVIIRDQTFLYEQDPFFHHAFMLHAMRLDLMMLIYQEARDKPRLLDLASELLISTPDNPSKNYLQTRVYCAEVLFLKELQTKSTKRFLLEKIIGGWEKIFMHDHGDNERQYTLSIFREFIFRLAENPYWKESREKAAPLFLQLILMIEKNDNAQKNELLEIMRDNAEKFCDPCCLKEDYLVALSQIYDKLEVTTSHLKFR